MLGIYNRMSYQKNMSLIDVRSSVSHMKPNLQKKMSMKHKNQFTYMHTRTTHIYFFQIWSQTIQNDLKP